jgi:hypothetical protein
MHPLLMDGTSLSSTRHFKLLPWQRMTIEKRKVARKKENKFMLILPKILNTFSTKANPF